MQECPLYVWTSPYVWIPPVCLDICHMFICPVYVVMKFGCLLYIHNTKNTCFVRLRGCPYAPIHLDAPICLDAPCMSQCPLYVLMAPYVWTPPHMFGCPLYVWMMFRCLLYIYNTKKACFVKTEGVHMPHIHLDAPVCLDVLHMFGCPLYVLFPSYVWTPPICLDALCMFG